MSKPQQHQIHTGCDEIWCQPQLLLIIALQALSFSSQFENFSCMPSDVAIQGGVGIAIQELGANFLLTGTNQPM